VPSGRIHITGESLVAVNVTQHESALEAELSGKVLYEKRGDRDEDEVALDEVDPKLLLFRELTQLVGVMYEPARSHSGRVAVREQPVSLNVEPQSPRGVGRAVTAGAERKRCERLRAAAESAEHARLVIAREEVYEIADAPSELRVAVAGRRGCEPLGEALPAGECAIECLYGVSERDTPARMSKAVEQRTLWLRDNRL
jgi:hypothetical protein